MTPADEAALLLAARHGARLVTPADGAIGLDLTGADPSTHGAIVAALQRAPTAAPATPREPRQLTPQQTAVAVVAALEGRGAVFSLAGPDDFVHCDLNGCRDIRDEQDAAEIAQIVLLLRDEIRIVLQRLRTQH
jgi:hypothetical protein